MKYRVLIEGGFTGIPREYEGELALNEKERLILLKSLDNVPMPNEQLRDALCYQLKLIDQDMVYQAQFDDSNLPMEIRKFIDTIVREKKPGLQ